MYGDRKPPEEPPCETCEPEFVKENEDAIKIFYKVRSQYIMFADGPVDIMHEPIHSAMKLYGVNNKIECFEKVLIMSQNWIERLRDK